MSTLFKYLCLAYTWILCYGIDRTQFSNFRGVESHDGYLSFSSLLNLPLSLKWIRNDTSCTFSNGLLNFAFTNDVFYCLTNEIWDLQKNVNSSVHAFNANNGNTLFGTYIDQTPTERFNKSAFDGIVSIPPNYIAILDNNNGDLFILNSTNGNIIYNITVDENCRRLSTAPCIESGLISSTKYKSIYAHFIGKGVAFNNATLFQFDTQNAKSSSIQVIEDGAPNPQIPTICNDDVIIATNLFGNASAYNISNSDEIKLLWNYSFTNNYGAIYINPVLCIPRIDGSFNVLSNSILTEEIFELWELIDGKTGKLIQQIKWEEDTSSIPAINTDKMIMIRTTIVSNKIIAYNISDINNNGNYTEIWNIRSDQEYMDILIINDNVYLSNAQQMDVYSIYNGTLIYSYKFPIEAILSRLAASIDNNNNPMIIIVAIQSFDLPDMQTILYALQYNE